MTAITGLLALAVLGTWLLSMVCLTVVTAQEMYDILYQRSRDYAAAVSQYSLLPEFYDPSFSRYGYQYENPDFLENQLFSAMDRSTSETYQTGGDYRREGRSKWIRDIHYPLETAVLVYDADGNLLHSSADDILYFDYYTQEEWDAGMDTAAGLHYGWMDIRQGKGAESPEQDPYQLFRSLAESTGLWEIAAVRVAGFQEGTEWTPVTMHYVTDEMARQVVENNVQFSTGPSSYAYFLSDVDRTGQLEWQLQFDHSPEYAGKALSTIYITHPDLWEYPGSPLAYKGTEYQNLAVLTESIVLSLPGSCSYGSSDLWEMGNLLYNNSVWELNEMLAFDIWAGSAFSSQEYQETGTYTIDFYLVTAIRSNPLACAVSALRNIYLATGLAALVLLLAVGSRIRQHLVQPVTDVRDTMEDGWL